MIKNIAIFVFLLGLSSFVLAEEVTLSFGHWPPYLNTNEEDFGTLAKKIEDTFVKAGYTVKLLPMPWKRAFESVNFGVVDGSFLWAKTEEREKNFLFSKAVSSFNWHFFL